MKEQVSRFMDQLRFILILGSDDYFTGLFTNFFQDPILSVSE